MPGFEAIYKQTVTVFNRKDEGGITFWYASVIPGVHLKIDRSIIVSTYGEQAADNAMLHIRYTPNGDQAVVATSGGGKVYLPPKAFKVSGNPGSNITFGYGDYFDFIFAGVYTIGETVSCAVKSAKEVSASVDVSLWRMSNLNRSGVYEFTYTSNGWTYRGEVVELSSYGVIVVGSPDVSDKIIVSYVASGGPVNDEGYKNGFYNYMNKTYDNVFAITNCSKFNLIPHFEITAR